jgi:hypothetical protein
LWKIHSAVYRVADYLILFGSVGVALVSRLLKLGGPFIIASA